MSETEQKSDHMCAECASKSQAPAASEQFIYALGRVEVRYPSVGLEREFQQRERALEKAPASRGERLKAVLSTNPHLAHRVCFIFYVGQVPAYVVAATNQHTLAALIEAAHRGTEPGSWSLLIGRRLQTVAPSQCGGVMAPMVACDQMYTFTLDDWLQGLHGRVEGALKARKIGADRFTQVARELFERTVRSTENVGALDAHRALNYLLVQHPGKALATAERADTAILDRIETRAVQGPDVRRQVAVVLTFLDRATGVPERLFCRVDVTEEWPFMADGHDGAQAPLGLMPFVDHALMGASY